MFLQIKWQFLQSTDTGVGTRMVTIKDSLIESLFPALFRGDEVSIELRQILGNSVKLSGLGIPDP